MRAFFDSSAFAKGYIEEPGSEAVERELAGATSVGVTVTLVPEVISAFSRLRRSNVWSPAEYRRMKAFLMEDVAHIDIVQLHDEVVAGAVGLLEQNDLRAADAVHVAAALAWRTDRFVSADRSQLQAAAGQGLETVEV